jgi:hypothetical protein
VGRRLAAAQRIRAVLTRQMAGPTRGARGRDERTSGAGVHRWRDRREPGRRGAPALPHAAARQPPQRRRREKESTSAIVPRYQRQMPAVNKAVVATYLVGSNALNLHFHFER